jgi:hypothetical protein
MLVTQSRRIQLVNMMLMMINLLSILRSARSLLPIVMSETVIYNDWIGTYPFS